MKLVGCSTLSQNKARAMSPPLQKETKREYHLVKPRRGFQVTNRRLAAVRFAVSPARSFQEAEGNPFDGLKDTGRKAD